MHGLKTSNLETISELFRYVHSVTLPAHIVNFTGENVYVSTHVGVFKWKMIIRNTGVVLVILSNSKEGVTDHALQRHYMQIP